MNKDKNKNLLIIVGLVIFVLVIIFLIFYMKKNAKSGLQDFFAEPITKDIGIDFSKLPGERIFKNPLQDDVRFKQLKSYFVEVKIGDKGRKNPFVK